MFLNLNLSNVDTSICRHINLQFETIKIIYKSVVRKFEIISFFLFYKKINFFLFIKQCYKILIVIKNSIKDLISLQNWLLINFYDY